MGRPFLLPQFFSVLKFLKKLRIRKSTLEPLRLCVSLLPLR